VGTNLHFASVRHPKSNVLVERANNIILLGITKSFVGLPKGKWIEDTSMSRPTGFTPFKLLFKDKVVTPEEIKLGSARVVAST
jgi:hypothetical protein